MKKVLLSFGVLLLAVSILVVACTKNEETTIEPVIEPVIEPTIEPTINNFFNIADAILVEKEMPEPTSDQTITVTMNENAIAGGSLFVTVFSEVAVQKILVGLKGQAGYYEVIPTQNPDNSYSFILLIDQNIDLGEENSFNIQIAIVDENGDISQIGENAVQLIEVGTGELQVSLTFDNDKDVDLHLIEPGGIGGWYDNHHIFYAYYRRISINGGELDLDSNPQCYIDGINNENITYGDSAYVAPGTYKVYVDMYQNCDETIPTNYMVTVNFGGQLIASRSGIFGIGAESTYNPIDSAYVANTEPFLTFDIPDVGQKRIKTFSPAPLTESAMEKEALSATIK